MLDPIASRRAVRSLLLGSHVLTSTGCTSWKAQRGEVATIVAPAPAPAADIAAGESSGVPGLGTSQPVHLATPDTARLIRITTSAGTVELRNPRVQNDSLYGQEKKHGPERAFAVGDITKVETHGVSAVKTVLLVVGVMAGALVVGTGVYAAGCGDAVFGC